MAYTKKEQEWFNSVVVPEILEEYERTNSVSSVLRKISGHTFGNITGVGRGKVTDFLKENNIYTPNSEKALKTRVTNTNKTLYDRYGVTNPGLLPQSHGYTRLNNIPYTKFRINDELKKYKEKVSRLTRSYNNTNKNIPKYCYYTGIQFIDAEQDKVNPNDPRKRSIDHRTSVIYCFLNGWSPEKCSNPKNMVYVLKYINTIKSNTTEKDFIPLALKLRKELIDEGFSSKPPEFSIHTT